MLARLDWVASRTSIATIAFVIGCNRHVSPFAALALASGLALVFLVLSFRTFKEF